MGPEHLGQITVVLIVFRLVVLAGLLLLRPRLRRDRVGYQGRRSCP